MGNWRRVQLLGTCAADEVKPLWDRVVYDIHDLDSLDGFGPLSAGSGLCGLSKWPAEAISAVGNMAERDYDEDSVKSCLEELAVIAPSLALIVHMGGDYEVDECVATVTLLKGQALVGPPGVEKIPPLDEDAMKGRLFDQLRRPPL